MYTEDNGHLYADDDANVISQSGHHLSLTGKDLVQLASAVGQCRVKTVGDPLHGYRMERTREAGIDHPQKHWSANAGIGLVVAQLAAAQGMQLRRKIHGPPITQLPAPTDVSELTYPTLAAFAGICERGLIRLPDTMDAAVVIAELCRAYPQQRIVVLGAKVGSLQGLYRSLLQRFGKDGCPGGMALVHDRQPLQIDVEHDETYPGLALATFKGAGDLDFATSHIVLLLDARECPRDDAQLALEQVDAQFRLFGIVRAGQRPAPSVRDTTMAVFGPQLIDLQTGGRVRRPVEVEWVNHRQSAIRGGLERSGLLYGAYIHNDCRNRQIARLARMYSERDDTPTVTILVEHLDHALALGRKLQDWPIISSGDVDTHGLPGRVRTRLKHDRQQLPGRRQIVLADVGRAYPGYNSDVVVMASSGPSVASLPEHWLYQKDGSPRPLRIVDFRDRFNGQTNRWSRQRRREYRRRDLFETGVTQLEGRIRSYIQENAAREAALV